GSTEGGVWVWDLAAQARLPEPPPLAGLWDDLGGEEAARAYRAVWTLVDAPGAAVPFLEERLHAAPDAGPRLARLLADLDDDSFAVRERATRALRTLGERAGPALRRALEGHPSPEVRRRVGLLLEEIGPGPDSLRTWRALEALELIGNREALRVLR